MAELNEADKRAIFGADYKTPEVTEASRAEGKAARRISMRNTAIGIGVVAIIILLVIYLGR